MEDLETFLQIQQRLLQHLICRNWIHGVPEQKSRFTHPQWKRVRAKHKIKIRDASLDSQPKILSSSVEEILQRIMGQTNDDCRFQIFILTNSPHHNICLLVDKIQDWGVFLFTISCGSCAVDQRSGDGWFNGWFKVFVFCKRNSHAEFWSVRCEDCFSTEQNHP